MKAAKPEEDEYLPQVLLEDFPLFANNDSNHLAASSQRPFGSV